MLLLLYPIDEYRVSFSAASKDSQFKPIEAGTSPEPSPDRKFLFSLPIEEGTFLLSAVLFRGRVDHPDITAPSPSHIAAFGSLSPSVYARWDGL